MNRKNLLMLFYWRYIKASGMIGVIRDAALLAGIWGVAIHVYLREWGVASPEAVWIGMVVIGLGWLAFVSVFGYAYDKAGLWKEEQDVAVSKNPYAQTRLMPRDVIMFEHIFIPLLEAQGKVDEADWLRECVEKKELVDFGKRDV